MLDFECQKDKQSPPEYRQSSGGYSQLQQSQWTSHPMELTPFNNFDTHITEQIDQQTNTTGIGVQGTKGWDQKYRPLPLQPYLGTWK